MERGSGSEGRRRGGGQHMKCAERQMEELTEDKQTPCSHSVRHLRQAQIPNAVEPADVISVEVSQHEQVDFSNTMAVEGRQKS